MQMDDIKDQNVDEDEDKNSISAAEVKRGSKDKNDKKIHLASRASRGRISDILHNLKNEISIRGEFEEYEEDLGDMDRSMQDGGPRIDDSSRDGMRLIQNYFSGP